MRSIISLILFGLLTLLPPASASLSNSSPFDNARSLSQANNQFLPVDQAFVFNHYQQDNRLFLDWQIKDGYYLYQKSIRITAKNATIDAIEMAEGIPHQDEFFGQVNIYTAPLFITVPITNVQSNAQLIVEYQGCAKAGFCYPPETKVIEISSFDSLNSNNESSSQTIATSVNSTEPPATTQNKLASQLVDNWWTPLLFFVLGVGLAFTPCVLPMYPIITSIVLGNGKRSHRHALGLSFIYVQGMALTYTLLGLVVASAGLQFQAAMQHPYVLITLSLLFIALAFSMFGFYTLQLPSSIQTKLNTISNKQQAGNYFGVFIMGAISGLVCSPCTTAPLSGALLYVAQSGDLVTGAITLYTLAIGMGIPLILIALFGNKLLPKAGGWMDKIKALFGFILLAAPIFLLERILPEFISTTLWAILGFVTFGWLYHNKNVPVTRWKQSVLAIIAIIGLIISMQPIVNYWFAMPSSHIQATPHTPFIKINSLSELTHQLELAKKNRQPVMLDFYADWCVACKEFEKYTFSQVDVQGKLQSFMLLQADVTLNSSQDIELLNAMGVLGLPTIEFWNAQGELVPEARITGYMPAETFLLHLNNYLNL